MEKDKIITRVKKLMAMAADGSSPNEAMIAAERARKLMDQHQSSARRFTPHWENVISVAIATYNDCKATLEYDVGKRGYRLTFKGFDEDIQVANYMFCYIIENGKRQCSKYFKDQGHNRYNARLGTSFKDSYAKEIIIKINELIENRKVESEKGTGLMVIKQQLVEQEFGETNYTDKTRGRKLDLDDIHAKNAGALAGENTNITTGIKSDERELIRH